jgi:hypothetical protein
MRMEHSEDGGSGEPSLSYRHCRTRRFAPVSHSEGTHLTAMMREVARSAMRHLPILFRSSPSPTPARGGDAVRGVLPACEEPRSVTPSRRRAPGPTYSRSRGISK